MLPLHLFVSARPAPHLPQKYGPIHHLPQAAFFSALEERYGMADEVLRDPELAALLYPSLKGDFEILGTWDYRPGEPIQVPLTALGALQDKHAERQDLEAWRELTTGTALPPRSQGRAMFKITPEQLAVAAALCEPSRAPTAGSTEGGAGARPSEIEAEGRSKSAAPVGQPIEACPLRKRLYWFSI